GVVGGGAVVDLVADGAGGGGGIVAGVEVGHRAQGGLVLGHGGRTAEGQHAGGGVVAAGDAVLVGEAQDVLAGDEVGGDRDRGAGEVGAVDVRNREGGVDRRGRLVLGVAERAGVGV